MKITKSHLKQIIKEELEEMLRTAGAKETSVYWDPSEKSKRTVGPAVGSAMQGLAAQVDSAFRELPQKSQDLHRHIIARVPREDRDQKLQDIAVRSGHSTNLMAAIKALEAFYEEYDYGR